MKFPFFNSKPKSPINPDSKAEIKKDPLSKESVNKLFSNNTSGGMEKFKEEIFKEEN
jgi:hypothetical protein